MSPPSLTTASDRQSPDASKDYYDPMGRNLDPKCKQCRRIGEKLFLKGEKCFTPKCPVVRRNYPPGIHGAKGPQRLSEYGEQLAAKQKAKKTFGLLERQFALYVQQALSASGNTAEALGRTLEMRLDNVVLRLGLAVSHDQARQLVTHGFLAVDGQPVNIPSFQLRPGMKVSIRAEKLQKPFIEQRRQALEQFEAPGWLELDRSTLTGTVKDVPPAEDFSQRFDTRKIIEFYSR